MARTKKQTIDAATARKRQFQEEIHNRSHVETPNKGDNLGSSASETSATKPDKLKIKPFKLGDVVREASSPAMSTPSKSTEDCNVLPQAVVRVKDICKTPADMKNEDGVSKGRDGSPRNKGNSRDNSPRNKASSRDNSPRNKETKNISPRSTRDISPRNKETRDVSPRTRESPREQVSKNIFEVMEMSSPRRRTTPKSSPTRISKPKDMEESLRELKSESERVRLEKSRKFRLEESKLSLSPKPPSVLQGRRSPRHQSPNSSGSTTNPRIPSSSDSSPSVERQKINIFTDDIGKDLGKRVRSPRRLSEDMIALPIFSLRKVGQAPKDNAGFSKYADDGVSVGFADSNVFKSPNNVGLSPSQKVSTPKSCECTDTFLKQATNLTEIKEESFSDTDPAQMEMSTNSSMSTICRDIVHEMKESRKDLFMTVGGGAGEGKVETDSSSSVTGIQSEVTGVEIKGQGQISEAGDASVQSGVSEKKKEISGCSSEKQEKDIENAKPSLLCAMLVGGSNVADSYSQERERYNPEVTEISDSETDNSRAVSPSRTVEKKQDAEMEVEESCVLGDTSEDVGGGGMQKYDVKIEVHQSNDVCEEDTEKVKEIPNVGEENRIGDESKQDITQAVRQETDVSDERKQDITQAVRQETDVSDERKQDITQAVRQETDVSDERKQDITQAVRQETDVSDENKQDITQQTMEDANQSDVIRDTVKSEIGLELADEHSGQDNDSKDIGNMDNVNDSKNWKKRKIEFSSQLKTVNEDVLKLLDIDVEEEFMAIPTTEEIVKETLTDKETTLYKLISNLCGSLRGNPNIPDSSEIHQMVEACPKGSVPVVSSTFSQRKWESILDRLKRVKSEQKKLRHRSRKERMDEVMESLVEKMSASTIKSGFEESNDNMSSQSKLDEDSRLWHEVDGRSEGGKEKDQVKESKEVLSSWLTGDQTSCLMSTSSSSLSGSLCELDLDGMTNAATQALKVSDMFTDSSSEPGTSCMSYSAESDKLNSSGKRKFQKSKTCGDFSQESPSPPTSTPLRSGTLRRTNSSPQLLKSDPSNSPSVSKDQPQVKSKLGGKIPVPGISYSVKSVKKAVRKPKIIMDPKPLDILLQFVNNDNESKDVFFSQDLHKFLWMPSNRMIVRPEIRKEIDLADKTAAEAWEKKLKLMEEEEERQMKKDEEVDKEYRKYQPEFDEVDDLLFISFTSQSELQAHVRVEKALEWDKDDTMLRIARTKIFEETKAQNGDMKGVKMKRLRGQHMRWKKYKRMYGCEVKAVLHAKEKNIPLEDVKILRKTYDTTKIKGWRKRTSMNRSAAPDVKEKENERTPVLVTPKVELPVVTPVLDSSIQSNIQTSLEIEDIQTSLEIEDMIDLDKKDLSPKSRRQFNFSDRRAHKQLFRELKMDWEDRMIHKKLGGWSLKGNRPKQFSQAAKKREEKEIKAMGLETPTGRSTSPTTGGSHKTSPGKSIDSDWVEGKKTKKLLFPLITEKMARKCLMTLETSGDVWGAVRRRRRKRMRGGNQDPMSTPPPPTPQPGDCMPLATSFKCDNLTSTPHSSLATAGSSDKPGEVSSPEASVVSASVTTATPSPCPSFTPHITTTASPSLSLDLPDDTVMEGVEIVSQTSSPSVPDGGGCNSPQVKSCSTPGCRYGCICYLLQSPVTKPPPQDCPKEYCRLGCICDSLQASKQPPTCRRQPTHCGKSSCMLECVCTSTSNNSGVVEDPEDLPFLSSMKQRATKAGERFSNLPRREKTHRSAKNLDAITRKAMMLYETSEIYCQKSERVTRKKSDSLTTSPPTPTPQAFHTTTTHHMDIPDADADAGDVDDVSMDGPSTVAFNAVNLVTSEVSTVTASHLSSLKSKLFPWRSSRRLQGGDSGRVDIEVDEFRTTMPVVEPNAHKRKRKSHPLSDEIFSMSSCARIQPYAWCKGREAKRLRVNREDMERIAEGRKPPSSLSLTLPTPNKATDGGQELKLKISGVCSLSEEIKKMSAHQTENCLGPRPKNNISDVVDLSVSKQAPTPTSSTIKEGENESTSSTKSISVTISDDRCLVTPVKTDPSCNISPVKTDPSCNVPPVKTDPSCNVPPVKTDPSCIEAPVKTDPSCNVPPVKTDPSCNVPPVKTDPSCIEAPVKTDPSCIEARVKTDTNSILPPLKSDPNYIVAPIKTDPSSVLPPVKSDPNSNSSSSSSKPLRVHHGRQIGLKEFATTTVQEHGWHTSMVCLKARAGPKTSQEGGEGGNNEDEVQEEDEVKLLEFAANCNWDKSKKEILSRVASCLTRGQYPQPRTITVRQFVVEILPKAKQPSRIPDALRAKLPGQMYSIRVRITKRDDSLLRAVGYDCDVPVIDLSNASPTKTPSNSTGVEAQPPSFVMRKNLSDNLNSTAATTCSSSINSSTVTTASVISSSLSSPSPSSSATSEYPIQPPIGISGLSRIYKMGSNHPSNSSHPPLKQTTTLLPHPQSKSAPTSRRSSVETFKDVKLSQAAEDGLGYGKIAVVHNQAGTKPVLDLSKIQLLSRSVSPGAIAVNRIANGTLAASSSSPLSSQMALTSNSSPIVINSSPKENSLLVSHSSSSTTSSSLLSKSPGAITTNPSVPSPSNKSGVPTFPLPRSSSNLTIKIGSSAPTSLLSPGITFHKDKPGLKVPSFSVAGKTGKTAISPTTVNELKYVQMLYEVEGHNEKKKTLIAVPISLTGASLDVKCQTSTLSPMPILTVPKPGATPQAKGGLPISMAAIRNNRNNKLTTQVIAGNQVLMKLPFINISTTTTTITNATTINTISSSSTLKSVQIIPLSSVSSSLLANKPATNTKFSAVLTSSSSSAPGNKTDCVSKLAGETRTNGDVCVVQPDQDLMPTTGTQCQGTLVTQSRERPISSAEVSPRKHTSNELKNSHTQPVILIEDSDTSSIVSSANVNVSGNSLKISENQSTTCLASDENVNQLSKHSTQSESIPQTNVISNKAGVESKTSCFEDVSFEPCTSSGLAVAENTSSLTSDETANEVNPGQAAMPEKEDLSQSDPSHSTEASTTESQQSGLLSSSTQNVNNNRNKDSQEIIKQPDENGISSYEVVDMDDLLVIPESDGLTKEEVIDFCYSSQNMPFNDDGGIEQPQPQPSSSNITAATAATATKRKISPVPSEDLECSGGAKKLRLLSEFPGLLDEDSNLSSLVTASPQSVTSLHKSAFSSGLSSGSLEDGMISSDEEIIDVGEDTASYQHRVEKAWVNDHSSMFSKQPPGIKTTVYKTHTGGCRKRKEEPKDRVQYHNYLERNRRAKLKELFDNLGCTILSVRGVDKAFEARAKAEVDGSYVMPKATILTEAKYTIMYLNEKDKTEMQEIQDLMINKEKLISQLKELKAQLLTQNVSGRAIAAILNKVSRQKGRQIATTSQQGELNNTGGVDKQCGDDDDDGTLMVVGGEMETSSGLGDGVKIECQEAVDLEVDATQTSPLSSAGIPTPRTPPPPPATTTSGVIEEKPGVVPVNTGVGVCQTEPEQTFELGFYSM